MKYFPFNCGDWASHTLKLNTFEKGVYITMLCSIMAEEEPMEKEDAYTCAAAVKPAERKSVAKVVRLFFEETADGRLTNKRAMAEIEAGKQRHQAAKDKADKRWGGKQKYAQQGSQGTATEEAEVIPEHCSSIAAADAEALLTINHKPEEEKTPPPIPVIPRTPEPSAEQAAADEIHQAIQAAGIGSAAVRQQIASAPGISASLIRQEIAKGKAASKGPGAIGQNILAAAAAGFEQDEKQKKARASLQKTEQAQHQAKQAQQDRQRQDRANFEAMSASDINAAWERLSADGAPMAGKTFNPQSAMHRSAVVGAYLELMHGRIAA